MPKTSKISARKKTRPQHPWLRDRQRQLPALSDAALPSTPAPRLLSKAQVCALVNASYPSVWSWMRAGKFPRCRVVAGRSMWFSNEIEAWLAALPVRRLKGDGDHSEAAE